MRGARKLVEESRVELWEVLNSRKHVETPLELAALPGADRGADGASSEVRQTPSQRYLKFRRSSHRRQTLYDEPRRGLDCR